MFSCPPPKSTLDLFLTYFNFGGVSLEGPVAPVALELPEVSQVKVPLKGCRATGECHSYTVQVDYHERDFPAVVASATTSNLRTTEKGGRV